MLRAAVAASIVALLAAGSAAGIAHAAPHARAMPAHAGGRAEIVSIYPVPHSSLVYGIATKGSRYYLVAGKNGHFKKVWAPKLGGQHGHLDSVYVISKNDVFIGGGIGLKGPADELNSKVEIWHKTGKKVRTTNFKKYNFGTGDCTVPEFAGSSKNDIWAIGSFYQNNTGGPQAMHWNGKKWSLVPVPQDGDYSGLTSIGAVSPKDAWAVRGGQAGDNDVQHWDGKAWTDSGAVLNLNNDGGISGQTANGVYEYGLNAKSKWAIDRFNGKKWDQMTIKGKPASAAIIDLTTVGKQGWALVSYDDAKDLPQAEILHSSGGSWTPQWKSHGGAWEFSSAFEVSSAGRGLFVGAHGKGGYDSPEHSFSLRLHGHKWKLGKLHVKA
jgi:hypothetical protein